MGKGQEKGQSKREGRARKGAREIVSTVGETPRRSSLHLARVEADDGSLDLWCYLLSGDPSVLSACVCLLSWADDKISRTEAILLSLSLVCTSLISTIRGPPWIENPGNKRESPPGDSASSGLTRYVQTSLSCVCPSSQWRAASSPFLRGNGFFVLLCGSRGTGTHEVLEMMGNARGPTTAGQSGEVSRVPLSNEPSIEHCRDGRPT